MQLRVKTEIVLKKKTLAFKSRVIVMVLGRLNYLIVINIF